MCRGFYAIITLFISIGLFMVNRVVEDIVIQRLDEITTLKKKLGISKLANKATINKACQLTPLERKIYITDIDTKGVVYNGFRRLKTNEEFYEYNLRIISYKYKLKALINFEY